MQRTDLQYTQRNMNNFDENDLYMRFLNYSGLSINEACPNLPMDLIRVLNSSSITIAISDSADPHLTHAIIFRSVL